MPLLPLSFQDKVDRAQGCLVGLAVGDALGATVEFLDPSEIQKQFGLHKDLIGQGWLDLEPGEVTDDTQLAKIVGESLADNQRVDPESLGQRFVLWLESKPKDVGATDREAFDRMSGGVPPLEAGLSGDLGTGNSCAVRAVPLGIRFYQHWDLLREQTYLQSKMTHDHEEALWGSLLVAAVVAWALQGNAKEEIRNLAASHFREAPEKVLHAILEPINLAKPTSYIVDTLNVVFYDFFHCEGFEESVISVVNRGGDSDTSGAILGALAGALYGYSKIPERWAAKIQWGRELAAMGKKLIHDADSA